MTVGSRWRARRWRYLGYATGALLLVGVVLTVGSWLVVRTWGPEQAREVLVRAAAEKAQAEWLEGARRRAAIRILISDGAVIPPPFSPP